MDDELEGPAAVERAHHGDSAQPHSDAQASGSADQHDSASQRAYLGVVNNHQFNANRSASVPPIIQATTPAPDFGLGAGGSGGGDGDGNGGWQPWRPTSSVVLTPRVRPNDPNNANFMANQSGATPGDVQDLGMFHFGSLGVGAEQARRRDHPRRFTEASRGSEHPDYAVRVNAANTTPLEERRKYIAAFSNRLAEDIMNVSPSPGPADSFRGYLPEWFELFSISLYRESITVPQRDAAALIHVYEG